LQTVEIMLLNERIVTGFRGDCRLWRIKFAVALTIR
jgi:hypothetical protein